MLCSALLTDHMHTNMNLEQIITMTIGTYFFIHYFIFALRG